MFDIKQKGDGKMPTRLEEVRKKARLTQKELAEKSGITRQTINALEKGRSKGVNGTTLIKLAKALDVKIDDIFFTESV